MNWEKLKPNHFFTDPVTHIYAQSIFDTKEYDKLYENQFDLTHHVWQEFDEKYKVGFEFKENFQDIDYNKEVMCLWFFKERAHRTPAHIQINGKEVTYYPNTFLVTRSKDIKFVKPSHAYIRYPVLQIDMSLKQYEDILDRFQK